MTSRLALIHNPRSRRNSREARDSFAAEAERRLGSRFLSPSDRDELLATARDLAAQDIRYVVVNGGDGTVSDVISAVIAAYPQDALPAIGILPSGNTNLIANDVGLTSRGIAALDTLLAREREGTLLAGARIRHPIVVSWPGSNRAPAAGMFCGLAAFTRGIELAHQPAILDRYSHDMAVFVTVLSAIQKLLSRETRRNWLGGTPVALSVDEGTTEATSRFLILCTSLHCLSRGVWPFWDGRDGRAADGFAFLDITAQPPRLLLAILAILMGRVPNWLRQTSAYRSGNARSLRIETRDRFVLDGEELDTGPEGCIVLTQGPGLAFLRD